MPWSGLSPTSVERAYEIGTSDAVLDQHHVGSRRADHGPKHEPGEISGRGRVASQAGRCRPMWIATRPRDQSGRTMICAKIQLTETAPLPKRDVSGGITRAGDANLRRALCQAATVMMNRGRSSWLRSWAAQVAKRRGTKRAMVALARRIGSILHRMWSDGTVFQS